MGQFYQLRDGSIRIITDLKIYNLDPEAFTAAFTLAVPSLPDGIDERMYEQEKRHPLNFEGNTLDGGPIPWSEGDDIIARADEAILAYEIAERAKVEHAMAKAVSEAKTKMDADLAQLRQEEDARLAVYMANRLNAIGLLSAILKRSGATDNEVNTIVEGLWPPPGTREPNPKGFMP